MSITIPIKIPSRGMCADPRETQSYAQLIKHFDSWTKKSTLIPFRSSTDAYVSQSTVQLQSLLMSTDGNMYALGVTGTTRANILKNSNIASPSWSSPTGGQGTTYTTTNFDLFFEYKGILWGLNNKPGLWSYNIGSSTYTEAAQDLSYTSVTQGLVHSKDDIAYFGYNTASGAFIASKNGSSGWSLTALTLPTNLKVVDICEYGNFLAILCAPLSIGGKSIVYLWDRDSSLTTLSESLDVGNRIGSILENIDGSLICICMTDNSASAFIPKIVFSSYSGGSAGFQVFEEIQTEFAFTNIPKYKQKYNNRLFFGLSATSYNHTSPYDYTGVWSVGKNSASEPFAVSFAQLANNDTFPSVTGFSILGFLIVRDYFYISYLSASTYGLSITTSGYSATSVWRTVINPNMSDTDKLRKKKLEAILLTYGSFPAAGSVTLKYRVDGGAWTSIVTEATQNTQFTEMPNANGTPFTDGRDYDFEIDDTGGVEITGFAYKIDGVPTNI